MATWKPIGTNEFKRLYSEQYAELSSQQKQQFDQHKIDPEPLIIRRSDVGGDETVYAVWRMGDWVLYFDDVEYGFNLSTVSDDGRILQPRGNQLSLREAIEAWFPKSA